MSKKITPVITLQYDDEKWHIAQSGVINPKFTLVSKIKFRPYSKQIRNKTLYPEISTRVLAEIYAETVVKGWDGVNDEQGNPQPFTQENVISRLINTPGLLADIQHQSLIASNFRE
jgi:hypothetical protein